MKAKLKTTGYIALGSYIVYIIISFCNMLYDYAMHDIAMFS